MTNSLDIAKLLLKETSAVSKRFEAQYRETGETYNIFKITKIHEDEEKMCRVLADLLNKKGLHYRGDLYFKLFMDMVVIPRIEKAGVLDLTKAKVIREHLTDKGQRIDIVIKEGKVFIPIETKINADDAPGQLDAYAAFSRKMNLTGAFIPVLFLTTDGHKSEKAQDGNYIPISFKEDIVSWLEACLEETKEAAPVMEVIKQYIKAIKAFCGNMEDEVMEKEIQNLILTSSNHYEAALQISKVVKELDGKVLEIFMNQILNLIKKEFPGAFNYEDKKWHIIRLGNFNFSVYYDMKQFQVQKAITRVSLSAKKKDAVISIMSEKTNDCNTAEANHDIWIGGNARYPGLDDYDDAMYKYEIYQKYLKDYKSIADWIVSIAKELEKILAA